MGLAETSNSTIFIGKSTTEDVEPTTYETIIPTGHTVSPQAGSFQSEDIDPSGKGLDSFRNAVSGGGDVPFHFRPSSFDGCIESALYGGFSAAFSETLTVSFGAPSSGHQGITDDGAGGVLGGAGNLVEGDLVLIGGAVADPANAGLRVVTGVVSANQILVWNPGGASSAADAGVTFDNAGTATLGTTKSWQWIERIANDGSNDIYSEFYSNCIVERFNLQFPAGGPSRAAFGFRGDLPTLEHPGGSFPQRGGSDNAASSDRLVHGMDDVRQVILYDSGLSFAVTLTNLHNLLEFTVGRNVRQDQAVGTSAIINSAASRPTVSGRIDSYINSVASVGTTQLVQRMIDNPDTTRLFVIAGATDATAYGYWFTTVRITGAPTPAGGNNQAQLINAGFSATDVRVSRIS